MARSFGNITSYAQAAAYLSKAKDKNKGRQVRSLFMVQRDGFIDVCYMRWEQSTGTMRGYTRIAGDLIATLTPDNILTWSLDKKQSANHGSSFSQIMHRVFRRVSFERHKTNVYHINGVLTFIGLQVNVATGVILNKDQAPRTEVNNDLRKAFVRKWQDFRMRVLAIAKVGGFNDFARMDNGKRTKDLNEAAGFDITSYREPELRKQFLYDCVVNGENPIEFGKYVIATGLGWNRTGTEVDPAEMAKWMKSHYDSYRETYMRKFGAIYDEVG